MSAASAVTAQFSDSAFNLSGVIQMAAGVPVSLPYERDGWFSTTVAGDGLTVILGGGVVVGGFISYVYF